MDTVYPEPIRLRLSTASRKQRGVNSRYRTQPVTFSEIKEVDEENDVEENADSVRRMSAEAAGQVMSSKSTSNVNAKYEELWSRRRADRKMNKKLQNRIELSKTPSVTSIPGSPENDPTEFSKLSKPSEAESN